MTRPPEANRLRADHAPTPFSAADIRTGSRVGMTIRLRTDVPGESATFRIGRYIAVDDEGAVQEFQATDADGTPLGAAIRRRSSWLDLQRHASQPAATTVIEEVNLELPFGTEACWLYSVTRADGRACFWFAKRLPGMPVQVEEWAGADLQSRSVMIESRSGEG
jgi:hypothetical protein